MSIKKERWPVMKGAVIKIFLIISKESFNGKTDTRVKFILCLLLV